MPGRHRDVTIREGTSEKNWYPIAGYLAITIGGTALALFMAVQGASVTSASGLMAIVFLVIVFGGVLVMPALFKDAAYVRDTRRGWRPKWWYYIGAPFVAGGVAYSVAGAIDPGTELLGALLVFIPTVFAAHALYLYRRHKFLGVP